MKAAGSRRWGLLTALIALVILLIFWWLVNDWYHAGLAAEARGQQAVVDRSVLMFRLVGLIIVGLATALTYVISRRQTQLSQTVQSQTIELAERLEQYRSVFETTHEALVIRDRDTLAIVDANPAYCEMYGTTREKLLGQPHMIGTDPATYRTYVAMITSQGQHRWEGTLRRADGLTAYVEAIGTTITYAGKAQVLVALRDITERVQAQQLMEQRVAERTRELETLLRVSHDLIATLDLKPLLAMILKRMKEVFEYDGALLWLLMDEDRLELLIDNGPVALSQIPTALPLQAVPVYHQAIRAGRPILIPDLNQDTDTGRAWRETIGAGAGYANTWLIVPLLFKDKPVGLLGLGHHQTHYYTSRHAELALVFANQAAIAMENARLYEQAQALASLEERRHLARELHDSVSQALYGIALGTRTARMLLDRDPSRLAEPLDYIMNLAEAGLSEMRALIFELRPEILEAEGLVVALTKQSDALKVRHKVQVITRLGPEPAVPLIIKEALYRIAQEATHNIIKHARASQIELSLVQTDGLTLEIKDDGQGFDPQQTFPGHLGLQSMRERVEKLGGRFELESAAGQGTTVRVWVPVAE
jgi:PAS domain S-box-containing protein